MLFIVAVLASICTILGGLVALGFRDKLHLVLGFSAGAVIGVALFDLLPEAYELSAAFFEPHDVMVAVAIGFFAYLLLDRISSHNHVPHDHGHDHAGHVHHAPVRGILGASTLSFHSMLDGVAIGFSFQASPELGVITAIAVLAHDFSDGINMVNVVLRSGASKLQAMGWLAVDALAPVLGIILTFFVALPEAYLGLVLALFAGSFLYISASDLIPESHHAHPKFMTTALTIIGALCMYTIISFSH